MYLDNIYSGRTDIKQTKHDNLLNNSTEDWLQQWDCFDPLCVNITLIWPRWCPHWLGWPYNVGENASQERRPQIIASYPSLWRRALPLTFKIGRAKRPKEDSEDRSEEEDQERGEGGPGLGGSRTDLFHCLGLVALLQQCEGSGRERWWLWKWASSLSERLNRPLIAFT